MDPVAFLRDQAPFRQLGRRDLGRLEAALEIVFFPAGTRILERGGPPAEHLFLVRSGTVRLEREDGLALPIEEGELFGYRSLITGEAPVADAWADTDVLCYRFAAEVARPLLEHPALASSMARGLAGRLQAGDLHRARMPGGPAGDTGSAAVPAGSLVTRPPLVVEPGTAVAEVARIMRDAGASSVVVAIGGRPGDGRSGPVLGILTDRDLRSRVVAEGLAADTPVEMVATQPALTLPASTPLLEVTLFMLERNVHHVPLMDGNQLTGVVSDTDVLRRQARSPLYMLRSVERAEDRDALAGYGAELAGVVRHLVAGGVDAPTIGRMVSTLNDTLVRTLLRLAEGRLGPPPVPYAWVVLGSEGRLEQALLTDQDNALVFAGDNPPDPGVAAWFDRLAQEVVGGLLIAGFPACPGGFMATRWHHPMGWWIDRFNTWISRPEPGALLDAAIFFDFRKVAGNLDLEPVHQVVDAAAGADLFLARMAASAMSFRPPLGAFRRIVTKKRTLDLKQGAVAPVVALARIVALAAGSRTRSTLERLAAAAKAGTLSPDGAADLAEAFRFVLSLRLMAQLDEVAVARPVDNVVELRDLAPLERHHLKDALVAIADALAGLEFTYQTGRLR